ncbi:sporulation integral membrane protein YtvI [Paenibacillus senegalensis]|uniref:sporulation integral membrane protein YtvI n=1 Tax=Paenibacillus senegalensis TaxID=1465766 RepID=UPI0002883823|nr:sporulation integral membrane protein YtvI [Paenibacillus senegalensis]
MSGKQVVYALIGIVLLYMLFTVGSPFLFALLIAVFLEPLIIQTAKWFKLSRSLVSPLICSLFLFSLMAITYGLGAKIVMEAIQLSRRAPVLLLEASTIFNQAVNQVTSALDKLYPGFSSRIGAALGTFLSTLSDWMATFSGFLFSLARGIPEMLLSVIVFLISFYMISLKLPAIYQSFLSLFEEESRRKVVSVLETLRKAVFGFFSAQLVLSMITFNLVLAGLFFMGVDYALATAFFIVLVDVLPILGAGAVLLPWAVYNYLTGDYYLMTGLALLLLAVTLIRRILEPKVVGDAIGVGALPVMISLFVGYKLIGPVGLFLGPVLVIIYQALRNEGLIRFNIRLD